MSDNRKRLDDCLAQAADDQLDIDARLTAVHIARQYLEGVTKELVDQAREEGRAWDALATVFATSPENVRSRFGSWREYDD